MPHINEGTIWAILKWSIEKSAADISKAIIFP